MCGIAGLVDTSLAPLPESLPLKAMGLALAHRGPDDAGIWQEGPVALVHRRLSIIDLTSRGRQPLDSPCGRVVVTFNGEIYNFRQLRRELEDLDYRFLTDADSEVLAAALAEWGEAALPKLVGMFAFAAWFVQERRLLLARDRTGIKPLVWQRLDRHRLAFASEIHALKPLWPSTPSLDMIGIHHYLAFGHASDHRTTLEGVSRLPSGHLLWSDETEPRCWWELTPGNEDAPKNIEEQIRSMALESIKGQLISERPVGLMLSGGLDSSILAHLCGVVGADITTYTLEYPDEPGPAYNEADLATLSARRAGLRHETLAISEQDVLKHFLSIAENLDEPNGGPALIPIALAFEQVKDRTTVILDGGGADELFGGYRKYLVAQAWQATLGWPAPLRHLLGKLGVYGATGNAWLKSESPLCPFDPQRIWTEEQLKALLGEAYDPTWTRETLDPILPSEDYPLTTRMQLADMRNHMVGWGNSLLDRASMRSGIEVREPWQDHRLWEFVFSLAERHRLSWPREKLLLKRSFARDVPKAILKRPKHGLGVPVKGWLRGGMQQTIKDWLSTDQLKSAGWQCAPVDDMLRQTLAISHNHTPRLWSLMMLLIWKSRL